MTALLQSVQPLVRCYWLPVPGRRCLGQAQDSTTGHDGTELVLRDGKLAPNKSVGAAC